MIEKFNGIFYLIVFIVHFLGYAVYAYRCVFGTKDFIDQYLVDHTAAIMVRFFGSFFIGSLLVALYIMFIRSNGVEGAWGFFNLVFVQNLTAFFVGIYSNINELLTNNSYLEFGKYAKSYVKKFEWKNIIEQYKQIL